MVDLPAKNLNSGPNQSHVIICGRDYNKFLILKVIFLMHWFTRVFNPFRVPVVSFYSHFIQVFEVYYSLQVDQPQY